MVKLDILILRVALFFEIKIVCVCSWLIVLAIMDIELESYFVKYSLKYKKQMIKYIFPRNLQRVSLIIFFTLFCHAVQIYAVEVEESEDDNAYQHCEFKTESGNKMDQILNLQTILSSVHSFEDYEILKRDVDIRNAIAKEIIEIHQLPEAPLKIFAEGTNIVFSYGDHTVIKIFPPFHLEQFKSELLVLKHLQGKLSVKTPRIKAEGDIFGWPYIVMDQLNGALLETLWDTMNHDNKMIIIRELGFLIREVHSLPIAGLEEIDCYWECFVQQQIDRCTEQHRSVGLSDALLAEIPSYLDATKDSLIKIKKPVLLTGEYTPMNFLVKQTQGVWHIDALIDFGDSMLGLPEYDLLGPCAFLIQGDKSLLREFLTSYGYSSNALTPDLSHQLMSLMLLHKYSNLKIQVRIEDWMHKVQNLKDLENLVWGF
jgi:hygromycin-B 7''-O-kinase